MTEKCFWCSNETEGMKEIALQFKGKSNKAKVCNATCEHKLKDFVHFADSHLKHYILGLTLTITVGLITTFWRMKIDYGALGVLIIFAGSGLILIKYPFVTPQSVSMLGAKKAIASGRFIGVLNIIIGIVFWSFLSFFLS